MVSQPFWSTQNHSTEGGSAKIADSGAHELLPRFLRLALLIELTSPLPKATIKAATGKDLKVTEESIIDQQHVHYYR